MERTRFAPRTCLLAALLLSTTALPALGAELELYGGAYLPGESGFDDGATYGLRGSWPLRDDWSAELSVGRWQDSHTETFGGIQFPGLPPIGPITVKGTLELTFVDLSAARKLGNSPWTLFGGPGWAFAQVDTEVRGPVFPGQIEVRADGREDSFSFHLGIAGRYSLGQKLYLRPDLRLRGFAKGSTQADVEVSVALGWRL